MPILFQMIRSGFLLSLSLREFWPSRSSSCGPLPQKVRPSQFGFAQVWLISAPADPSTALWITQFCWLNTNRSMPLIGSKA